VNLAEPTMVTIQVDSAWLVVLAVSLVTLPVVVLLRRLISGAGGSIPGLLLLIPLVLPLVAAMMFQHGVLPEISVLKPAASALLEPSTEVQHLLLLDGGKLVIPYALTGSAGPWLILFGGALSTVMLFRRLHGHLAVRRVVAASQLLDPSEPLVIATARLAEDAGLARTPDLFLSEARGLGAFATGGRRPAVVLSVDLLETLDDAELEAVIAHEVAHIAARDVRAITLGGVLRDMVAWNPMAHIAYRYLRNARELEADRRAAALTKNPLAVASGIVKMCKLVARRPGKRRLAAVAFLKRKERVSTRVSRLMALADGNVQVREMHWSPYLFASVLVIALGLQVGAQLARADGSALAFVWGRPEIERADVWVAEPSAFEAKEHRTKEEAIGRSKRAKARAAVRPANLAALIQRPVALRARDVDVWIKAVIRAARERGLAAKPILQRTQENWGSSALIGGSSSGSFGTYWIQREPSQDR
jgi:Zn-dependent protease with chaperone function